MTPIELLQQVENDPTLAADTQALAERHRAAKFELRFAPIAQASIPPTHYPPLHTNLMASANAALLAAEPIPGEAANAQYMGSVRDAITAIGGAAVALGLLPHEWLTYLSGAQFAAVLSALGVLAMAGRRLWSYGEAQKFGKREAQRVITAQHMEPPPPGVEAMTVANVAHLTAARVERAEKVNPV